MSIENDIEYLSVFFQSVDDPKAHRAYLRLIAETIKNKTAHNSDYAKCADGIQVYYEDHNDVYQSEIVKILKSHFA